jgi:hypothetical protein
MGFQSKYPRGERPVVEPVENFENLWKAVALSVMALA